MGQTTTPLIGVTPSRHPPNIVKWAARASADDVSANAHKILAYWDDYWEKNAGPPPSSHLPLIERHLAKRLLANDQSEFCRAQWVCTCLTRCLPTMSVSPSQPHLHKGGSTGPMTPHTAARSSTPMAILTATPPTNVANGITTAPTTTSPLVISFNNGIQLSSWDTYYGPDIATTLKMRMTTSPPTYLTQLADIQQSIKTQLTVAQALATVTTRLTLWLQTPPCAPDPCTLNAPDHW